MFLYKSFGHATSSLKVYTCNYVHQTVFIPNIRYLYKVERGNTLAILQYRIVTVTGSEK